MKNRKIIIKIIMYLFLAVCYLGVKQLLAANGLEYRHKFKLAAELFLWFAPIVYGFHWLVDGIQAAARKRKRGLQIFLVIAFLAFVMGSVLASVKRGIEGFVNLETETKMADGFLQLRKPTGWKFETMTVYAEPVWGIARKEFHWDPEHYAKSLSRQYGTVFVPVTDPKLGQIYTSEAYPHSVKVRVWGTSGSSGLPTLRENLSDLLTEQELRKYLSGKASVELVEKEVKLYGSDEAYTTLHVVVYKDKIQEASEDLAEFIRREPSQERRGDGKKLWKKETGYIRLILKENEKDSTGYTDMISFGALGQKKENVTSDDILYLLNQDFCVYERLQESRNETVPRTDPAFPEESEEVEEPEENGNLEAVEQSNEISDGYAAIYEAEMADKENARYESRVDAKGKEEVIVYETTQKIRFLRFDRESANGKCLLYVYYESGKGSDGGYSPTNARILDMYAYEIESGKVYASGKTGWADTGSDEYRQVTGE